MYNYKTQKPKLLTDEGQKMVMKAWDNARRMLEDSGAFLTYNPLHNLSVPDTWMGLAIVDRLVELGYIREVTGKNTAGQDRVFVSAQ